MALQNGIKDLEELNFLEVLSKEDQMAQKSYRLGRLLADSVDTNYISGEDIYRQAYNDPFFWSETQDVVCLANSAFCSRVKDREVIGIPEGHGSNDLAGAPSESGDSGADNNDDTSNTDGNIESGLDPSIRDVNLDDDLDETPILKDETTRTVMQLCQEKEERKLWQTIDSTETDATTTAEKPDEAQYLLDIGVCDTYFYGKDECRHWNLQQDSIALTPKSLEELRHDKLAHPLCPVNLITPSQCELAKEKFHKRFVLPIPLMEIVDDRFIPTKPIVIVPRLDLFLDGNGNGVPPQILIEKKPTMGSGGVQPVLFPRIPGTIPIIDGPVAPVIVGPSMEEIQDPEPHDIFPTQEVPSTSLSGHYGQTPNIQTPPHEEL